MECILDILDFAETEESEIFDEFSIIPKDKIVLGLDISVSSSGLCMYDQGVKFLANIVLETKNVPFEEVQLRRELKDCLSEVISGKDFDLILIEDAFQGIDPVTTRKLYAINTAIDELILDGVCTCKNFRRVNNQQWKKWLYSIDKENIFKGITDKIRIQKCLEMVGITDKGFGFQDRLDATGLLIGYFLRKETADKAYEEKQIKKVLFSDIEYDFQEDDSLAIIKAGYGVRDIQKRYIEDKRISKNLMIKYLSMNPNCIHITRNRIQLGILGSELDLPLLDDGGYLAFWVKESKVYKYKNEEDYYDMC